MAKRRRLDPATSIDLADALAPLPEAAPETKSMFTPNPLGVARMRSAPIAAIAGESSLQAALDAVTDEMARARHEGRLIQALRLDEIHEGYLVRDRLGVEADEMAALTASLRERGQQTPIEVADLGPTCVPRFGLISGWRRLIALRSLAAPTIQAIIRPRGQVATAYLAMVEENEIRANLSFYERARIVARAADAGVFGSDRQALSELFRAAPRAKRSKVNSFVRIVRALDGPDGPALRFPTALSERAGLELSGALDRDPSLPARLRNALLATPPASALAEGALIRAQYQVLVIRPQQALPVAAPAADIPPPDDLPDDLLGDPLPASAPGLELIVKEGDRLVLRGPTLRDPAFHRALADWLRSAGWLV